MTIQEILGAFLSASGQHDAACEALASTNRLEWTKLADYAIRTAPEFNKTHAAHVINLALDALENGGQGTATDFIIRPAAHKMQPCVIVYRGYQIINGCLYDTGLLGMTQYAVMRRIVGLYSVRQFIIEGNVSNE